MRKTVKYFLIFCFTFFMTTAVVFGETARIPEGGAWWATPGAKAKAYDAQSHTLIVYSTEGYVTTHYYGMTVYVKKSSDNFILASSSSTTPEQRKYANYFNNTGVGPISHYHELRDYLIAR